MALPERYRAGVVAAVHGAYGLSDVFDLRLQLSASRHAPRGKDPASPSVTLGQASVGVAYKLDVIEWVPYFGVRVGGLLFNQGPVPGYDRFSPTIGGMAGVDYAFSRNFGAGAELAQDLVLPEGSVTVALARLEYRWGF